MRDRYDTAGMDSRSEEEGRDGDGVVPEQEQHRGLQPRRGRAPAVSRPRCRQRRSGTDAAAPRDVPGCIQPRGLQIKGSWEEPFDSPGAAHMENM